MCSSVAARLAKKLVRGARYSSSDSASIASCRRRLASRLARAWVRRKGSRSIAARPSERPAREPALDLRAPVVAPERLAVDDEEGRAEDAVRDSVVADRLERRLPRRVAPDARCSLRVEAELEGERLQVAGVRQVERVAREVGAQAVARPLGRARRVAGVEPPEDARRVLR